MNLLTTLPEAVGFAYDPQIHIDDSQSVPYFQAFAVMVVVSFLLVFSVVILRRGWSFAIKEAFFLTTVHLMFIWLLLFVGMLAYLALTLPPLS